MDGPDPLAPIREQQERVAEADRQGRAYQARIRALEDDNRDLRKVLGLADKLSRTPAAPAWTLKPRSKGGRHVGIVCAQLTDTHFDEVVEPIQVDEINAYDRRIAELRLHRWVEKVIVQARDYIAGVEIEGLFVPATGDILSGDIHEELKQTNEGTLYESADHWIGQLTAALRTLAEEFGKLHVACVVGNHGRNSRKPVFKDRAQSNIEWLLWRQVAARFAGDPRVTFQVSDAMDLTVRIYETNYTLTHGDQFRGGSGISAELAPLLLGVHRKTVRQMATARPMHVMVLGHFHQYMPPFRGMIMGGSLKGYDEFAYGLNLRPEPAMQALWVSTPEHGPTISLPIIVQNRKAEGW